MHMFEILAAHHGADTVGGRPVVVVIEKVGRRLPPCARRRRRREPEMVRESRDANVAAGIGMRRGDRRQGPEVGGPEGRKP